MFRHYFSEIKYLVRLLHFRRSPLGRKMTYRRERGIREMYDDRFLNDRQRPYARGGHVDRRPPFPRQEEDYGRYDFDGGLRFYPNGGGPRNYHDDGRGYHGDNAHFSNERRGGPPSRRVRRICHTQPYGFARGPPPHNVRGQGLYPAPRSLPESGEDSLVQAILNLDRGEDRDHYRRKAGPFPSLRERSPVRREAARSPHSRSGSSVSSRGYSPDRTKPLPFPSQQSKSADGPDGHTGVTDHLWGSLFAQQSGHDTLGYEDTYSQSKMTDKIPGLSREGSPHSATSIKEESHPSEAEKCEVPVASQVAPVVAPVVPPSVVPGLTAAMEKTQRPTENLQERRAQAIAAKAQEIEKMYRQDCETFGIVVKMLVAKDPNLEKQLQVPLRENLGEIRERCLEELKLFINQLDSVVRQPETSICDSNTPSTSSLTGHKLSKTTVNHRSSY
ncbi:periphilin-1 [Cynoglossus semilaevis]|uniref:periphilin-1 n=1 Tax=Cynoglossus semilaevis TaxID=244447 RepID=UPI0007DCB851|nr:periphilin-1 [Cynoglossus semilaevis]